MGTSYPLTLELVLNGVVQGLLGLDQSPEILVYQIASHGEIFMFTTYTAASQWQWFSTEMGESDGDAWHLFGKPAVQREKGTGEGNDSEELRASPQGCHY